MSYIYRSLPNTEQHIKILCTTLVGSPEASEEMGDSNLQLLNTKLLDKIRALNRQMAELKLNNESKYNTVMMMDDNAQSKIDQLLAQLTACEDENKKLRENIQHIQDDRDTVVTNSQHEVNQLKQSLSALQSINSTLESNNDLLSRENYALQGKNAALSKELSDMNDELTKEHSRLQGMNAALTKELADIKNGISKDKSAAQGKNVAVTKELADIKDELSRENSSLRSKNAAITKELASIKVELTKENSSLRSKNAAITKELGSMKELCMKDKLTVESENVAVDDSTKPSIIKTKQGKIKKAKQVKSVFNMDDMDSYDIESNINAINVSQLTASSVVSSVSVTNIANDSFIPNSLGTPSLIVGMEQKLSEIHRDDQLSWSGCMKNLSIYPSSPYHRNNVTIKKDLSDDVDANRSAQETVSHETQPHLIVLLRNGENSNNLRVIDNNGVTIGRENVCDIRIKLPSVSRLHAKLIINGKGLVVMQNFSKTNPTLLNDIAIDSAVLKNGDIISIASRYFRFQGNESNSYNGSMRNDHIKFNGSKLHKQVPAGTINALSLYNKLVSKTDKKNIYSETESSIIRKISRFSESTNVLL